ncbi:MAG: tRNA dihydrouridine synthase DusB [Rhodovibrionaceae bacterium]
MSISIGPLQLRDPVVLAPMSGVTDLPFRRLVKRLGAGLVVSEMIASQAMVRQTRDSLKMSTNCAEEFPMAVQLAGCEPEVMAEAAKLNADRGAAIIDINFGCPVKKIVTKHAGSALMREEGLAGRIMEAVVEAVDLPVTMKMRLGWDHDSLNAPRLAKIAEEAGIKLLTVHGRTRCQFYKGEADWSAVRATKQATRLPVIVNGDIQGPADIDNALERSGADGVMIGRGACGRPWMLSQAAIYLREGFWPEEPSLRPRLALLLEHYEALLEHYGREQGLRIARKHLGWYSRGLEGSATLRETLNRESDPRRVVALLRAAFAREEESAERQVAA